MKWRVLGAFLAFFCGGPGHRQLTPGEEAISTGFSMSYFFLALCGGLSVVSFGGPHQRERAFCCGFHVMVRIGM